MSDYKYLASYTIPLSSLIALHYNGMWSYLTVLYAFIMIPLLEPLFKLDDSNDDEAIQQSKSQSSIFDYLLYLNLPLIILLVLLFLFKINSGIAGWEIIGLVLSVGISLGSNGINVAHELGHKPEISKKVIASMLLLPSLYMHFTIEHNYGHHKNVATDKDPASAKKNQNVYSFWVVSMVRCFLGAWKIESSRVKRKGKAILSLHNNMLIFSGLQLGYLVAIWFLFDYKTVLIYIAMAVVSMLLLETINYIEHYGLRRSLMSNGRYERVMPIHSWNSNHQLGRLVLYELTRHSDHHYLGHKKYQNLEHHEESKQLPFGYPTSMLLSLCPPLWFKIMNPRV